MNAKAMGFGFFAVLVFLLWLSVVCGIGYIAVHFILKFW
jgi:hypothetical protein